MKLLKKDLRPISTKAAMLIEETLVTLSKVFLMEGKLNLSVLRQHLSVLLQHLSFLRQHLSVLLPNISVLRQHLSVLLPNLCFKSDLIPLEHNNKLIK